MESTQCDHWKEVGEGEGENESEQSTQFGHGKEGENENEESTQFGHWREARRGKLFICLSAMKCAFSH